MVSSVGPCPAAAFARRMMQGWETWMGDTGTLYQLRASGPGVPRDPTGATLRCTISHGFLSGTPVCQRCVEAAIAQCPSEE